LIFNLFFNPLFEKGFFIKTLYLDTKIDQAFLKNEARSLVLNLFDHMSGPLRGSNAY